MTKLRSNCGSCLGTPVRRLGVHPSVRADERVLQGGVADTTNNRMETDRGH